MLNWNAKISDSLTHELPLSITGTVAMIWGAIAKTWPVMAHDIIPDFVLIGGGVVCALSIAASYYRMRVNRLMFEKISRDAARIDEAEAVKYINEGEE